MRHAPLLRAGTTINYGASRQIEWHSRAHPHSGSRAPSTRYKTAHTHTHTQWHSEPYTGVWLSMQMLVWGFINHSAEASHDASIKPYLQLYLYLCLHRHCSRSCACAVMRCVSSLICQGLPLLNLYGVWQRQLPCVSPAVCKQQKQRLPGMSSASFGLFCLLAATATAASQPLGY